MVSRNLKHFRELEQDIDNIECDIASAVQELHELICDLDIPLPDEKKKSASIKKFEDLQKWGTEKEMLQFFTHLVQNVCKRVRKTLSYIEQFD